VTFKRNGDAVPSPLWFGLDAEGRFYSHTMADGSKVKRLRNDPRVLLVASTRRGKPIGPVYHGLAREVPAAEEAHAEAAMAANYGLGRKVYMATSHQEDIGVYLEVAPLPER
jgi:PPOX class probable F420-dependent enzyme